MKKLILIAILLIATMTVKAQNASMDLAVLTGGVAYQKFADHPKMDNVLHFWAGYFGTNALQSMLDKTDLPKWAKKSIPPFITVCAIVAKENIDSQVAEEILTLVLPG